MAQTKSTSGRIAREIRRMASSSIQSVTVLTNEDGVPGSILKREPEEHSFEQLKWWLKCRGLKLSGKRDDLVTRVRDCVNSGNHHTLDPGIPDEKFGFKDTKRTFGCTGKMQCKCCYVLIHYVQTNVNHFHLIDP